MIRYDVVDSNLHQVKPLDGNVLVIEGIEKIVEQYGLLIDMRTTLSSKKGSTHWHLRKGSEKGVLEITYWPKKHQLWVEIHDNRRNDWNAEIIRPFADTLANTFGGKVEAPSI
jgi:hypothetical protein